VRIHWRRSQCLTHLHRGVGEGFERSAADSNCPYQTRINSQAALHGAREILRRGFGDRNSSHIQRSRTPSVAFVQPLVGCVLQGFTRFPSIKHQ
jgi:hypothetical protein